MENVIATKTINGFSINLKDWVYEGQIVSITMDSGELYDNSLVESIIEGDEMAIIRCNGMQQYIPLSRIEDLEIIERRKVS